MQLISHSVTTQHDLTVELTADEYDLAIAKAAYMMLPANRVELPFSAFEYGVEVHGERAIVRLTRKDRRGA